MAGWEQHNNRHDLQHTIPGLDLYHTRSTADRDLSSDSSEMDKMRDETVKSAKLTPRTRHDHGSAALNFEHCCLAVLLEKD